MNNTKLVETMMRVEAATVWLPEMGVQGVLVPGRLILTAAHCIRYATDGSMALDDTYHEPFETRQKETQDAAVYAVEPVADIAALGGLDNQEFPEKAGAYQRFCETTGPVPVCAEDYAIGVEFPVYTLAHTGEWITGRAVQWCEHAPALVCKWTQKIQGGTSGGPVINAKGELVGLVVHGNTHGQIPRPCQALPCHIWHTICGGKGLAA
jgi:hypothetical protein